MLPDQPDNPTRPKILHPQHARPPPHPHHLSGAPSQLFKTTSRLKVQVIQNSVTMHTLLGYQSRVSTIRSQVRVLLTGNRLLTWNSSILLLYLIAYSSGRIGTSIFQGARCDGDRALHSEHSRGESRGCDLLVFTHLYLFAPGGALYFLEEPVQQ